MAEVRGKKSRYSENLAGNVGDRKMLEIPLQIFSHPGQKYVEISPGVRISKKLKNCK